ncbi:MAG TPA: ATP-binding protein [Baekduia sp.]|nr:ATP-binding protein [Baekduia sp.]
MSVPELVAAVAVPLAAAAGAGTGFAVARRAARERAARIAHEVRGPLAAGQLALHAAARRGQIRPRLLAALELELRRALAALHEGRREPAVADVDLADLLRCQVETWQAVAAAHGVRLTLVPGPGTALVCADALRVAQATANVVANAIEHGGGTVEVRTRRVGDRVRVEVSDGGPGLPASVAELARRPRAGRGERGRGLAIAAGAVAGCGGRVVSLPTAAGARVAIELPVAGGGA